MGLPEPPVIEAHIHEWLNLVVRWIRMITGIAWIGASFYFNWVEGQLNRRGPNPTGIAGDLWAVHGGGFYHSQKYQVAPEKLPEKLHWFKWEAYMTWVSGMALLVIVYFWQAESYMVDPAVADLSGWQAIAINLGAMLLGWLIYDQLCRSPFGQHNDWMLYLFIVALPIVALVMFVFGWISYILIIKRVIDNDMFVSLLATFGLSLFLQQVMNLIYGPEVQTIDSKFPIATMFDGFVTVPMAKVVSLLLAAGFATIIVVFMKKSRTGQAIRATAQDPRAARVLGINTDRIYAFTFSLNAAICGVAGVLVSIIWVLQPFYGIVYSLRTFAIVTAAGLGNLPAVIGVSFVLGWVEQYAGIIMGAEWQIAAAVMVLLGVLVWRQIQLRRQRQVVR